MSFQDSAVIFFIALLLFGPRKLPELARQLGKLMGEFRRASNEFRMQMEDELRVSEQNERQKQIAAIEAAAPAPAIPAATTPEPGVPATDVPATTAVTTAPAIETAEAVVPDNTIAPPSLYHPTDPNSIRAETPTPAPAPAEPLPIATSGSLRMMPPDSGLPLARSSARVSEAFDSIPEAAPAPAPLADTETPSHA